MAHFLVTRKEVWNSVVLIEAPNKFHAIAKVEGGEGREIDSLLEYNHTLESDTWNTEEISEEIVKEYFRKE